MPFRLLGGDVFNNIVRKIQGVTPSAFFLTMVDDADAAAVRATIGASSGSSSVDFKDSVRAATTANGTLATAYENGDTIDGVVLATGDRILLKDQTTGSDNGIYTVNASGAPTRATDFDADAEVTGGCIIPVSDGTANGNTLFMLTTNDPITVGSTAMVFSAYGVSGGSGTVASSSVDQVPVYTGTTTVDGDTDLTFTHSTAAKTFTITSPSSTALVRVTPVTSGNSGFSNTTSAHPGSGGGLFLPFVAGAQSDGPGIWWTNGGYSGLAGIWLSGGFNFQGWNSSNSSLKVRKGTGTSTDGAVMFQFDPDTPLMTLGDAVNIAVNTTTGTKIATATGQKLGFWNATPVVQQVLATGAGATVDNVISLLQTLGLCKQS